MEKLATLVASGEDRIIHILHGYTLGRGYAKYSSTLEEAWRMSVRILSANLGQACRDWSEPPELGPDDNYSSLICRLRYLSVLPNLTTYSTSFLISSDLSGNPGSARNFIGRASAKKASTSCGCSKSSSAWVRVMRFEKPSA